MLCKQVRTHGCVEQARRRFRTSYRRLPDANGVSIRQDIGNRQEYSCQRNRESGRLLYLDSLNKLDGDIRPTQTGNQGLT
ncbi:hypothetical protein DPMN_057003 [Dreissena polymorpha]|uniref:Uncharacterized protein n=1 Tax=Dreissena polymorpha TaxID=45954 RepID=A0A9D4CSS8_DREPO|nr:hypothetical protein DPMN_057003 [Dreissena polymorpha]